jgi:hypothetical protein
MAENPRSQEIQFTTNFRVGKAVLQTLHGRQYLVAPMTSIVPGVLSGSRGALLYPEDQVSRNVQHWDGLPLTAWHPQSQDGSHVSASSPGVLDRQGIGVVRDSAYNGKLQHKAWFDVERVRQIDNSLKEEHKILPRLARGEPIELSTGLYTDNEPAPSGSSHNGVPYDFIASNYRGDHIAVLPDQVGACSLNDGCGILINKAGGPTQNIDVPKATSPTTDPPSIAAPHPEAKEKKPTKAAISGPAEPTQNAASDGHPTVEELGLDASDLDGMDDREVEQLEERTHSDLDDDDEEGESPEHRRKVLGRNGAACSATPIRNDDDPISGSGSEHDDENSLRLKRRSGMPQFNDLGIANSRPKSGCEGDT